jgi:uncharacterized protein YdiU (UPF0061 family)
MTPELPLRFDNSFLRETPGDPEAQNYCRQVFDACWSRVETTAVPRPTLIAHAHEVAALIGLQEDHVATARFAQVFAGNASPKGSEPYAMCYGGHQFGGWAGQLGDGRAIALGEVLSGDGQRWELQLKGAGPTPYSRRGDGRAVLRSSIREFLCSESMHHLGVPSTRALSLITTGEPILRDMFYDGRAAMEPGAIVCRVAPSFIRFGNFEILASRQNHKALRDLAAHTLARHFPELGPISPASVVAMLDRVSQLTAVMIAHWMRVGFVHGVMNTDNMSVLGLTIDYGPYGWLDDYDEGWTPNTTDASQRRYRFGQQPAVAHWNLACFARALMPLVQSAEPLQEVLNAFPEHYLSVHQEQMASKLGLKAWQDGDRALTDELRMVLQTAETDMTLFYRQLAQVPVGPEQSDRAAPLNVAFYSPKEVPADHRIRLDAWLETWSARVRADGWDDQARRAVMDRANPCYVLRNYLAQEAIDQATAGDPAQIKTLLEVLRRPYEEQEGREQLAKKRPEWARHKPGCSMLSCSS